MKKWEIVLIIITLLAIIIGFSVFTINSINSPCGTEKEPKMLIATVKHPDGSTFNLELDYYIRYEDVLALKCLDGTEYLIGAENVLIVER